VDTAQEIGSCLALLLRVRHGVTRSDLERQLRRSVILSGA
jgi:hypothetical protein